MKTTIFCFSILLLLSCNKESNRLPDTTYQPDINLSKFTNSLHLTNKFFNYEIGKTYIYEGQTADGKERDETTRLSTTKIIVGIPCLIIEDKAYLNGKLIELTHDWYAQDNEGNVWYMGEQVDNYDLNGKLLDHHGSWETGIDGAKAGIIMLANPQTGMKYRQEYFFNEAEDEAEILSLNESVTLPSFNNPTNCLKTKEFTELEPDALEYKIYAPSIGLIKIINVTDKEETVLIKIQ